MSTLDSSETEDAQSSGGRAADRPASRPSSRRTTLVALVVFFAGLALVGLATAPRAAKQEVTATPLPVRAAPVTLETGYTVRREFVGRVEARRTSQVGFELGGLVNSVRVDEGDTVTAGQVLAVLDTRRLQARKAELEAARDQAAADVELSRLTRDRVQEASDLNAVSPQVRDEAELAVRAKAAGLERARSALASLDVELEKSRLTAPYDSLVAARMVDEGQVIGAGTPVLHLLESSRPEVRIGLAGAAVQAVEEGARQELRVDGRLVGATVRALLPLRQSSTRSVDVIFQLDAELTEFRSGDLAHLELPWEVEEPGFWLPLTALTESARGLWAAYVVRGAEGDTAALERREFELLHQEADRVYLRGRMEAGDRIVLDGLHRLVPGQVVRIVDSTAESKR